METCARMPTNKKADGAEGVEEELPAAYPRRSWPHPAIKKYTGTKVSSKKTKNRAGRERGSSLCSRLENENPNDEGLVTGALGRYCEGDREQQTVSTAPKKRDAVHPEAPRDPKGGDPRVRRDELIAAVAAEKATVAAAETEHGERATRPTNCTTRCCAPGTRATTRPAPAGRRTRTLR